MLFLEVMDAYISAHCDQQLSWIKPSGPALTRTMSLAAEETSVSPATGSSGQVCQKTGICLGHLLARAWLLSCNANGCTWGPPPKIKSKKNSNASHHHSYNQSSQHKFLGKADTKIFAKFHWSSALFFFTLCALPLQFSLLLVKDTFYEVKLLE